MAAFSSTERRLRVREEALAILRDQRAVLPVRELSRLVNEVSDEVVGLGPIEFLLKDPEVSQVTRANRPPCLARVPAQGDLLQNRVQMPGIGDALQVVLAPVVEHESRASDQILDSRGDKYLFPAG